MASLGTFARSRHPDKSKPTGETSSDRDTTSSPYVSREAQIAGRAVKGEAMSLRRRRRQQPDRQEPVADPDQAPLPAAAAAAAVTPAGLQLSGILNHHLMQKLLQEFLEDSQQLTLLVESLVGYILVKENSSPLEIIAELLNPRSYERSRFLDKLRNCPSGRDPNLHLDEVFRILRTIQQQAQQQEAERRAAGAQGAQGQPQRRPQGEEVQGQGRQAPRIRRRYRGCLDSIKRRKRARSTVPTGRR